MEVEKGGSGLGEALLHEGEPFTGGFLRGCKVFMEPSKKICHLPRRSPEFNFFKELVMKLGNLPPSLEGLMKLLPLGPKVTPQDMEVKKQLEGLGASPELFKEAFKKHIPPGAITKTFIEAGGGKKGLEAVTKFIQEAKAPETKAPPGIAELLDIR